MDSSLLVALASLVGSFIGSLSATVLLSRKYGRDMAKGYRESMHDYLKREEEALNEKIQRSKF